MNAIQRRLEVLCGEHPKLLKKGGLCVALVVTQTALDQGLPIHPSSMITEEGGQVAGLGKGAVQRILEAHGIHRVLAEEGGRTSRGSILLMNAYVTVLNELHHQGQASLKDAMDWWIGKVRSHFATDGPRFHFAPGKSLRSNIDDLFMQAKAVQDIAGGTNYVGAMLQHLIGAKLDLVLGVGTVHHHGFSVADRPTSRPGDFQLDEVVLHVTTHPNEALIRKCAGNLGSGLKPVILTLGEGLNGAVFLLRAVHLEDRVDVLDAAPFLTANVYERSLFQPKACQVTLSNLLRRYNEIVDACETDPSLRIRLNDGP